MFEQSIFSIGITTLQLNGLDNNLLCEQIKIHQSGKNIHSERDMNVNNSCLNQLNSIVTEHTQKIVDGLSQNKNVKVNLKRVWGNYNFNHNICTPHTHRDSFLSAVYYPKSTDAKIHFYSPWTDAILSHLPFDIPPKQFNQYNSSFYEVNVKTGMLVIFPAHLPHFVPISKEERFSIAYDIGCKNDG